MKSNWDGLDFSGKNEIPKKIVREQSVRNKILLSRLEWCKKSHKPSADPRVIAAIDVLISEIAKKQLVIDFHDSASSSGGRVPIIIFLWSKFGPLLEELMPPGSLGSNEMNALGTPIPIKDHLISADGLRKYADNLKIFTGIYWKFYCADIDNWRETAFITESINCIAEIFDGVREAIPNKSIKWCASCFRRADEGWEYCLLHRSANNTAYKKANKHREDFSEEIELNWKKYKQFRSIYGDSFEIYSDQAVRSSDSINCLTNFVIVVNELKVFIDNTLQSDWHSVCVQWDELLIVNFPIISKLLVRRPAEFESWMEFSKEILHKLEDHNENTMHPLWILHILACAEEWKNIEIDNNDNRKTNTAEKIEELYLGGMTEVKDLSNSLGISEQYIGRILNQKKLKQSSKFVVNLDR